LNGYWTVHLWAARDRTSRHTSRERQSHTRIRPIHSLRPKPLHGRGCLGSDLQRLRVRALMRPNVADNRLPEAVRLIGGLGAAPTRKALRQKSTRLLEREPVREQKGRPRAATQNGRRQARRCSSSATTAQRLGVQPKPQRGARTVAGHARAWPPPAPRRLA